MAAWGRALAWRKAQIKEPFPVCVVFREWKEHRSQEESKQVLKAPRAKFRARQKARGFDL